MAVDSVPEMLALAPTVAGVEYRVAPAETLPFEDAIFDAVTVSSGVHWFDQPAFFMEARRVLKEGAWLALYDHYFLGEILDDPAFATWASDRYLSQYPTPPRGPKFYSSATPDGFVPLGDDNYEDPISLSHRAVGVRRRL